MQYTKNIFYIFFVKQNTSHLIAIKINKPHINQILEALINKLLNPRIYIETCSYIFTRNTTWFYLSFRYLTICQIRNLVLFLSFIFIFMISNNINKNTNTHTHFIYLLFSLYIFFTCKTNNKNSKIKYNLIITK